MPHFPGPLQGLHIVQEDGTVSPLMGTGVHVVFLDGAGMAPVRRILEKAPLQHGAIDRGFRVDPRQMVLQLMLEGESAAQADALRDRVAYLFGPTSAQLKLRATRDDGEVRQIDCYLDGTMDFQQSDRMGGGQRVAIPLLAPDPSWYDPTQVASAVALIDGTANLDLAVDGLTWEDWPVIDITGPVDANFQIQQATSGDYLFFSSAIPSGETFRIDLRPGYKTIRRTSDNANRLSYLDSDYISTMSDMRVLSQKMTKAMGTGYTTTNRFAFVATGTSGASAATIYWYQRWLSL